MTKKVLFVATVVKKHINVFHIPYLKWFKDNGYETHVCASNDFDGQELHIPYCDVFYDIPFERYPFNAKNISIFFNMKKIIDTNNYEIIHCHTPVASIIARIASIKVRNKGTKIIYTAHGFHFYKGAPILNWLLYFPIELICSSFTDVLITINSEDFKFSKNTFLSKSIKFVPGVGINTKEIKMLASEKKCKYQEIGLSSDATILISVGEINENKNHKIVLRAIALLMGNKEIRKDICYLICGSGDQLEPLIQLSEDLGIEKNVKFLGYRHDVKQLLQISDIFIFPSLREGLPVSLMEAMAFEIPCIVSKVRGNVELIHEPACLLNPNDAIGFANSIKLIMEDRNFRERVIRENLNKVRSYDIRETLYIMEKIYNGM